MAATCLAPPAFLIATASGALAAPDTAATGANAPTVQEVVVTAERRSTNIQATPIAITAISANALDRSNINDVAGLNGSVPGLTITKTGGRETVPTIRGIGSSTPENTGSTGPGVSMFVDGVYIGDSVSPDQGFFDLDHIEVLRGPQGTLYGVSSTGGAIMQVSKQPRLGVFDASGDVSVGTYNYHRERAEVNIPVGDQLAFRLSAQKLDHDGFTTNTLAPSYKLDDAHTADGKAAVSWRPVSDFTATLTGQWYHQRNNGQAQKWINDPNPDPRVLTQDFLGHDDLDSSLYHLNLSWDTPSVLVRSVSAYREYNSDVAQDVTFTAFSLFQPYENVPTWKHHEETWSEELDFLSPDSSVIKWTAGIFLMRRTGTDYVLEYQGNNPGDALPTSVNETLPASQLPQNLVYGNSTRDVRTAIEPFIQVTYPITSTLRLTAGARYNYESHDHTSHNFSTFGNSPAFSLTDTTKVPTWRAQLDYDVSPNSLLYASAATGYKAGGVNGNATTALVPLTFKPEKNTAFEVGSKNFLFNKTLRANFAAFYYLYKNMQYIETDPIPFDQGMNNIPKINIYGVEGEINYVGLDGRLRINGNIAIEHGQVKGSTLTLYPSIVNATYNTPACAYFGQYYSQTCWNAVIAASKNIQGASPPALPKVTGAMDASYDFDVLGGMLTPRVEYIYRGAEWARIFNEPAVDRIKAYSLVNLNVTYVPQNSNIRLSLTASNVFNKAAVNSRYTSPYESGLTSQQFVPPRQVIGTVFYAF